MTAPRCRVCGYTVKVALTNTPGFSKHYAAWCGCEATSSQDPQHRGVGYGQTEEEAVIAWQNWKSK